MSLSQNIDMAFQCQCFLHSKIHEGKCESDTAGAIVECEHKYNTPSLRTYDGFDFGKIPSFNKYTTENCCNLFLILLDLSSNDLELLVL